MHVHANIDVSDRCVSRCLCGQSREVSEGSAGFLSFHVQGGATVLAYRSHLSTNKKGFVVLDRTRSLPSVNSQLFYFTWNSPYVSAAPLVLSACLEESFQLYYFFCGNFDSCRSGHPRWVRQTDTERHFDMMTARVIVLFQSLGERGSCSVCVCVCAESSCQCMAKICSEAEMGEALYNNLTEACQIN